MTVPAVAGMVYARANWGRWVGDCPALYCRSATQLRIFEPVFRCYDCGAGADVTWPPYAEDVQDVLNMRPDPATRNWSPGEPLDGLLRENLEHGIHDAQIAALGVTGKTAVRLFSTRGNHMDGGELASAVRRQIRN